MENSELDTLYFEQIARIGKALSSPSRLKLLDCLAYQPRSVDELARRCDLSTANTSQHLQKLKEARLVESDKDGLNVYYRLAAPEVSRFYRELQKIADQRLFEIKSIVEQYHRNAETLEKVDFETLARRARAGEAVILDVRPADEYHREHFPGAISVPLENLESWIDKLPRDKEIFAYCRGDYCVLSDKAVQKLRAAGYKARNLPEGIEEWKNKKENLARG